VPVEAAVVEIAACEAQRLGELVPRAAELRAANENASLDAVPLDGAEGRAPTRPPRPVKALTTPT
jgi:hypothetical protein